MTVDFFWLTKYLVCKITWKHCFTVWLQQIGHNLFQGKYLLNCCPKVTSACIVPWSHDVHIKIGYVQDLNISVICVNWKNDKNGFECTRFVNCLLVIFVFSVKMLIFHMLFSGQLKFKQGRCLSLFFFLKVLDLL